MIREFLLFFILFSISSLSTVYGQMDHDSMEHVHEKDFSELLMDEVISKFFSNNRGGDIFKNFEENVNDDPSKNNILIKEGTFATLSGSSLVEFSTILVEGDLKIFDTGDSSLRVQKIIVGPTGSLTIGNNQNPIEDDKKVEIVFSNNKEGEIGIFVFGKLVIFGKEVNPTFAELKNYVSSGKNRLELDEQLKNWSSGDTVVITSPGKDDCNEVEEILKIVATDIILKNTLKCSHIGDENSENTIDSHVALLSRNVKISSGDKENRGSVNYFHGSTGYIKYAQFDNLGPKEVLGRYPIHFHHMKDTSRGIEVIGNSITNSDNRWITIHDSNGIIVKNNVGYISHGHGFFLEDGNEFDNVFEKNIGIITKKELITQSTSSVFWTQNPMNVYRDNVAVNGQYWGFFFDIPKDEIVLPYSGNQLNLRSLPSLEFNSNIAYNNGVGGMKVLRPVVMNPEISSTEIIVSNFKSMSSRQASPNNSGFAVSGSDITILNSTLLNNKFGIFLNGENNKVLDTKITIDRNRIPDTEISGIVIAGANNLIIDSEIKGYISKNNNQASDISVSNNKNLMRLLSAKIIDTSLLDTIPFYFGNPVNEKSFLEIYGYDAPFAKTKNLPDNFILKKIGSDIVEERGEYNNLEFDAIIKIIPDEKIETQMNIDDELNDNEKIKTDLMNRFKNKISDWNENSLTDEELINEIEILIESRLIEIDDIEIENLKEIELIIPPWMKKLVDFWNENSISQEEFINALEYILKINISKHLNSY